MIDLLMIAATLFAAPPRGATAATRSQTEQGAPSMHDVWQQRADLQERQSAELLEDFKAASALYREGASGDTQADASLLDAVTSVARAYHAACAKADIAGRFAAFVDSDPSVDDAGSWVAAETGRIAAIDGKTRELQQGLMQLIGHGIGPSGTSEQWSAVLAAEGWRAGAAGELRLIAHAMAVHYAQAQPAVPAAPAAPAAPAELALADGV